MKSYLTKPALLAAMLACSCEYEKLPTYSGQDQIYFAYADDGSTNTANELFVHFGYDEPMKPETTLYVSVKVMGSLADVDRPVSFVLVDSLTTATPGRDVELLPEQSFVPAGKVLGSVAVKIKNTAALYDTVFRASIRLVGNEYFHADYTKTRFPSINTEGKIVSTEYHLQFDNASEMPRLWIENLEACTQMFGEYSNVKFELMCRLLGFDREYFSYEDGEGSADDLFATRISSYAISWNQTVNQYLNRYEETYGFRMLDENGKEIKMGLTIS
jgi:hypothetical protein